jgi:hypothetical protein
MQRSRGAPEVRGLQRNTFLNIRVWIEATSEPPDIVKHLLTSRNYKNDRIYNNAPTELLGHNV